MVSVDARAANLDRSSVPVTLDHLVDVILPVRDGARYIATSIRSLQSQTFATWRLLVLDDGSSDDTASIVESMMREDPRLSLIRLPAAGLVTTLNLGLRHAAAPLIARQDADDISLPHRLEQQVRYLQDNPLCAAVSGGIHHIDRDGSRLSRDYSPPGPDADDPFWIPAHAPSIVHGFLLARRDALLSVNGYRHFVHAEDADLCWRLAEVASIVSLPGIVGQYRIHETSVSALSIVNARIQSITAHLAAIAARRRRAARGDLDIHPDMPERLARAASLVGMAELFRGDLDPQEFHFVLCGSVMWLLRAFLFRPLWLGRRDVRLAAAAWRDLPPCTPRNRTALAVLIGQVVRRLRANGQADLARELAPDGSSLLHHLGQVSRSGS